MKLFEEKKDCCGCTACMNICPQNAIEMKEDEEGFKYPIINKEKCIECGLCKKTCAFQNGTSLDNELRHPKVYAVKNKNEKDRIASTSGGLFIAISDYVLKNNGIIYGVAFDKNFRATHIRAEDIKGRDSCIGSKYSQSELNDIFKRIKKDLENNKLVLFTGTPCQVAGLNRFLGERNKEKLILVDIICHGTPSPKLFGEYIKYIEKKRKNKIIEYYHRPKDFGWDHNEKIIYKDKKEENKSNLSQAWKHVFYSNFALRPACYNCKYTNIKRLSDITIADFWGIEKFAPEFVDKKGISLAIINTLNGEKTFKAIDNSIEFIERSIDEAKIKNPNLLRPTSKPNNRNDFWKEYQSKGISFILKKYGRYNLKSIIKNKVKNILKKTGLLKLIKK